MKKVKGEIYLWIELPQRIIIKKIPRVRRMFKNLEYRHPHHRRNLPFFVTYWWLIWILWWKHYRCLFDNVFHTCYCNFSAIVSGRSLPDCKIYHKNRMTSTPYYANQTSLFSKPRDTKTNEQNRIHRRLTERAASEPPRECMPRIPPTVHERENVTWLLKYRVPGIV